MQIGHEKLSKGQKVWYRYSEYPGMNGPYIVDKLFSDHEGRKVRLKPLGSLSAINLRLADDDDFGMLLFYDSDENH
jgi:hypothetical protein